MVPKRYLNKVFKNVLYLDSEHDVVIQFLHKKIFDPLVLL